MKQKNSFTNKIASKFIAFQNFFNHHHSLRFLGVVVLLVSYITYISFSHGIEKGLLISFMTWSFFVLCTPIADAGALIDFPVRLLTGIKMVYSEIVVWIIAIVLNVFVFFKNPAVYDSTILLSLLKHIFEKPFPYWAIIFLSALGTFFSVYVGDKLLTLKKHEQHEAKKNFLVKHKILIFVVLILFVIVLYDFLLNKLGVHIPLL